MRKALTAKNQLKQQIMEIQKFVLYYGLDDEVIGVRPYCHDWQEGEVIKDNEGCRILEAKDVVIYAVFWNTVENVNILLDMFRELNTATSMKGARYYFEDEPEILDYCRCNKWTMKKRVWGNYEKRLDYMEKATENLQSA